MSQQLQQTRYDQLIRRAGGLIGGGAKVSSVIPELFPVLELEDTTPELLALSGWRVAWQSTERSSGVGNNSTSELFNPANSGIIAAITQVIIRVSVTSNVQAQIVAVALGNNPVPGLFRDSRFGTPRNTTLQVDSIDGGATGGGLRLFLPLDEPFTLRDDNGIVILTPGTGLQIGSVTSNLLMSINYFWRERIAEQSELSFP